MNTKRKRVLIGKIGLDGHDRGAKLVARSLCDAGVEVIYTGIRQSIDGVIATAVQEDVAVIGLSFLSGDHMALLPKVMKKLKESGLEDVKVIVGGIILPRHVDALTALGIHKIFLPGTPMEEIVDFIKTA
ncbi:MAG: cobalamin B12-binding domain-containing protein [Syntrophobacteraceae bacterium]